MLKLLLIRLFIFVSLGLSLTFFVYKIYESNEEKFYVQQHSPAIKVPVVHRERMVGNLTQPHLIYVRHHGKEYRLGAGSKYFRITAKLDSVEVKYDAERGIVVLADGYVRGPYFLFFPIFLIGLWVIGKAVYDFIVDYLASR